VKYSTGEEPKLGDLVVRRHRRAWTDEITIVKEISADGIINAGDRHYAPAGMFRLVQRGDSE